MMVERKILQFLLTSPLLDPFLYYFLVIDDFKRFQKGHSVKVLLSGREQYFSKSMVQAPFQWQMPLLEQGGLQYYSRSHNSSLHCCWLFSMSCGLLPYTTMTNYPSLYKVDRILVLCTCSTSS